MAINLRVAAGGAAERYLEKKDEHEAFLREMDLTRRQYLAEEGKANFEALKKAGKEAMKRVRKGISYGFSEEAAVILELGGMLEGELKKLNKIAEDKGVGAVNESNVEKIGDFIVNQLKEEDEDIKKAALEFITDGGYPTDVDEIQNKFFNVLLSVTGTTEEAAKILRDAMTSGPSSIDPSRIPSFNRRGFADMDPNIRKAIQQNINNKLTGIIDVGLDETGQWQGTNAREATRISNQIFDYTRDVYLNPGTTFDPGDFTDDLIESVRIQRQGSGQPGAGGKSLDEIVVMPITQLPTQPLTPSPPGPKEVLPSNINQPYP